MTGTDVLVRAGALAAQGVPFALATVVGVRRPASARRGDRALVTSDGVLEGWVGGACSEPIVIREALRALADGESRLVRIAPPGTPLEGGAGDAVVAESSCASEGIVEVLVEPQLPGPLLALLGDSPVNDTLARIAPEVGWRISRELGGRADAVLVATMGHGDEDALETALALGTGYVGLVASSKRAGVVLRALRSRGVDEESLARVRSPAGLDLGPATQPEIAVAVLAELVAWRRQGISLAAAPAVAVAVDPVCGMEVAIGGATPSAEHDGQVYYFCCASCRDRFESEPGRYLAVETGS